ncbi:MAG: insulinase family protein, partial [Chlamydiia bacterium]|nr:insulinase family protein [Chlamydiia bacterium]
FPTITYGVNSGGDPKKIPDLTYAEFKDFWSKAYHPSRALFFFYGNFPLEEHLAFLNEHVLKDVSPLTPYKPLPREKRYAAPVQAESFYPTLEKDAESLVSIGWLTCPLTDQKEVLALEILDSVLTETDASPLRKALISSGLCTYADSHLDNEISEVPFVLHMQGCKAEDAPKLEEVALNSLRELAREGIPKELIESAFHQLEITRSEINNDSLPYGLQLFFRSALLRMHHGDPSYGLKIHSLFDALRKELQEEPRLFERLLEKYLIDNPHRVCLTLKPSMTQEKEELAEEEKTLSEKECTLSASEKEKISKQAEHLIRFQEEEISCDCLPKTDLSAVPKEEEDYPLGKKGPVYHHACFTNGILYGDLVFKMPKIETELLPYVRYLGMLLGQLGAGPLSWDQLLGEVQAHTGGIWAALSTNVCADDPLRCTPTLHLRGKALHRNKGKLFHLLSLIASETRFTEKERIQDLVFKHATLLQTNFTSHALKYAMNLGASARLPSGMLNLSWFGLEHYTLSEKLSQEWDKHAPKLFEALNILKESLLSSQPDLVLSCTEEEYLALEKERFFGVTALPQKEFAPFALEKRGQPLSSCIVPIAAGVAFNVRSLPTIQYTHPDAPLVALASNIYDNEVLHARIREQGGAYGSGASCSTMSGAFTFYSYRDPNIEATYKAFEEAIATLSSGDVPEDSLEEAKREIIQGLDHPTSPGSRAEISYGYLLDGRTLERRQAYREKVLSATLTDVIAAADKHVKGRMGEAIDISFAGKELLQREKDCRAEYKM